MESWKREAVFYGVCAGLAAASLMLTVILLGSFQQENTYTAASDALRKTTQSGTTLTPPTRDAFTTGTKKISRSTPKSSARPTSTATTRPAERKTPGYVTSKTPKPRRTPTPKPTSSREANPSVVVIDLPVVGRVTLG